MSRLPARLCCALAALLLLASCAPPEGSASEIDLDLPFEHYSLDNGLEVILRKDDRIPIASVNVWYHVGPANEVEGRRGFAHLFEHMMLQGSGHAPGDYYRRLQAIGATGVNGNTDLDRTAFVQDVPSDQLELALWAESDRMGFLLDALDRTTLRNQQSVIRNERRQNVDNAPYGLAHEELYRQLFPPSHPYHHYIYGSHADMQAAELDEVREFFRRYYGPNNASLSITGNIDLGRTRQMVEKYFGSIPRGPEVPEVEVEVPQITEERRSVVTDAVELPRVYLAWVTPEAFSAGDAQAALAARMLGGGKASRLYRDLVHDLQIAQSVEATQRGLSHGSVFQITATAKPGHTAEQLEAAISRTLDRMAEEGPGAGELEAAKVSSLAIAVKSLEPFDAVADRLNAYNHFLGDPGFLEKDLQRVQDVTAGQVREFVEESLDPDKRVVVVVNPGHKVLPPDPPAPPPLPAETEPPRVSAEPWRKEIPQPTPAPRAPLPVPESFRLDNGLTVYLVRRPQLPLVTVQVTARSSGRDGDLPGLTSFTAEMINEGAGERGSIEIANDVTALGSTLETGASRQGSWVIAQTLRHNLDATVAILTEVVLRPTFPPDELERIRTERLAALQQQQSQPMTTALKVTWREHFGADHAYGHLGLGTADSNRAIDRNDLLRSYRRDFSPANSALILTGDLTEQEARRLAEDAFAGWEGGRADAEAPLPPPAASAERVLLVDRPGSPQTALVLAQPGVARQEPDFDKLLLVNGVLGDLFSSRLNQSLRERLGVTYGVDSEVTQSPVPGLIYVSMSVDRQQTGPAVAEALAQTARLKQDGLTQVELDEAREAILRSLPAMFRTNGSTAGSIAHLFVHGLPQSYYRGLEKRLAGVTIEEANTVAAKWLRPEAMKIVAVGDRTAIDRQLQDLNVGPIALRTADALAG